MVEQPNGESDDRRSDLPGERAAGGRLRVEPEQSGRRQRGAAVLHLGDAEGALASEAWELDGDGDFDDASGSSTTASFGAGDHEVSLRVTDGDGVSRVITRTITVARSAGPAGSGTRGAAAPAAPAAPKLMSPFPTVRLVGVVVPRGARITLVEVRGGPRGARVTVRCSGEGCPFRSRRRIVETGRVRLSDFTRVLAGRGAHRGLRPCARRDREVRRLPDSRREAAGPHRSLSDAGRLEPTRCT